MKKLFGILVSVSVCIGTVCAQEIGGELIGAAQMNTSDALKYSQSEHTYMTARVAAMGGAFTSLGADLSSMAINPAGLGMYRRSEASFSAAFSSANASNAFNTSGSSENRMMLNNAGVALNLYQSSGALVSYTFGFGYNKLSDFNYNRNYSMGTHGLSIADFFAAQIDGLYQWALKPENNPFTKNDIYPDEWGGVLAYQTGILAAEDPQNADNITYWIPGLYKDAEVLPTMDMRSRGYVGEYDISSGFNIGNKLYLGFTLGIQDIYQNIKYNYQESFVQNLPSGSNANSYLRSLTYAPEEESQGTGVNFKAGLIWRPVSGLRLGIAYHTPTAVALNRSFYASMKSRLNDGTERSENSLVNSYTYNYASPSKLLLGASYTIGSVAVVSFDYDWVWYNGMRLTGENFEAENAFRNSVESEYKVANNLRAGLEIRPVKSFYLRGGYAVYGSPLNETYDNDQTRYFYSAIKRSTEALSLGLGFRLSSGSSIDFAWIRSSAKYTNYLLYSYYNTEAPQSDPRDSAFITGNRLVRNTVTASYSFIF